MGNPHAHSQNWAKLVRDLMPVLVICKFDENPIKMKSLLPGEHFLHCNSRVNSLICPKINIFQDFMAIFT